jgi:hypothetical protein
MKNIFKINMVGAPLMFRTAMLGGGTQMAQGYGREVAKLCSA